VASVVVIADDITGASAIGGMVAERGRTAVVTRTIEAALRWVNSADAVIACVDSRHLPACAAARRVHEIADVCADHAALVAKRIDSTLRGNVGAECEALLTALRARRRGSVCGLVVPAHPASGRTTVGGVQLLDGVPLARTHAGSDPFSPVRASRVASVLAKQTRMRMTELNLDSVREGVDALATQLRAAAENADFLVVDAASDADLHVIAAAATRVQHAGELSWMPVDPGSFTCALTCLLAERQDAQSRPARRAILGPYLAVVGSLTAQTVEQVDELVHRAGARVIEVGTDGGTSAELATRLQDLIASGAQIVGVRAAAPSTTVPSAPDSERTRRLLGDVCGRLAEAVPLGGIYATGGEIAASVLDALGADALRISREVLPMAVVGTVDGGPHAGLPMATKDGLIGPPDAALRCVGALRHLGRGNRHPKHIEQGAAI
jgi:uncharacterized protein YgbK (DUF1537 family)